MLYRRIINQGTINEPGGKPEPHFTLPSTINWMHALRIIIESNNLSFTSATLFYHKQAKRSMINLVENTVLEQLFLGLHHLSALEQFRSGSKRSDYARIGILTWYYGIANAASAMTAAQAGSFKEDHSGTARLWDAEIARRGLAVAPFDWRVSSLVEKTYKAEIAGYKGSSEGKLLIKPMNKIEAGCAAAEYLSGSAKWYEQRAKQEILKDKDFKALNVLNFRTKAAQAIRDSRLEKKSMGFIHQASRYRGKANYREALFLAYGANTEKLLAGFSDDLAIVLRGFLTMAGAFASIKLGATLWSEFVADVDSNRSFSINASSIWK